MISIIDFGVGNILALMNVFRRLNITVSRARTPADLASADKLLLPGVGAFDNVMRQFTASPLRAAVEAMVLRQGVPILGICVGMQMLADSSEEGTEKGLGWITGAVRRFRSPGCALPHMGWNDVKPASSSRLFDGLEMDARFYFLHSYYFECVDTANVLATTDYGGEFAGAVGSGHIFGVQFHPEKSHHWGERLLKNFAEL